MANRNIKVAVVLLLLCGAALAIFLVSRGNARKNGSAVMSAGVEDSESAGEVSTDPRPMLQPFRGPGKHLLRGVVRGADGSPVVFASVSAVLELGPGIRGGVPRDGGPLSGIAVVANTDAQGEFVLEGLLAGRYRLLVESPDVLSSELRFVEVPGQELQVLVARSVQVQGVVRSEGVPVAAVKVYLQSESDTQQQEGETDAQGKFIFDELPEGNFKIYAIGDKLAAPLQLLSRFGMGPFEPVSLALEKAYTVEGRVVEEGGSTLGIGAELRLRDEEGVQGARVTWTAPDGSFSIPSVLGGRWVASASAPGFLPSETQSFLAESERSMVLALRVGAAVDCQIFGPNRSPVEGAVVVLAGAEPGGEALRYGQMTQRAADPALLPGQRLLPRGELGVLLGPIPMPPPTGSAVTRVATLVALKIGAPVALSSQTDTGSRFVTDAKGSCRITGVRPGQYRLLVSHGLWANVASEPFSVRGGQSIAMPPVRMHAGTRVLGKVLDDRGVPIGGASVLIEFADGRVPVLSVSEADGSFVVEAIVGRASILVSAVGHAEVREERRLATGTMQPVERTLEFRLERADAFIASRVVDESGFPLRGATLQVEAAEGSLPTRVVRSDAEGLFRIDGLLRGKHWVLAEHAKYPAARVQLKTEGAKDLVMPLGGGLEVLVLDRENQRALATAKVELQSLKNSSKEPMRTVAGESGKAQFSPLAAGDYLLKVQLPGYAPVSSEVRVPKGQRVGMVTRSKRVELVRGATIAGILRDSDGDRLVGATLSFGLSSTRSDGEGRFRLHDLASGVVRLRIEHDGQESEHSLKLAAGEERVTLELTFEPLVPSSANGNSQDESPLENDLQANPDDDDANDEDGVEEDSADPEIED